jgi:hypothetical protein
MKCTVTIEGRTFTFRSRHSDAEALRLLREHLDARRLFSSFADDLINHVNDGRGLTREQLDWVHKLVRDCELREKQREMGQRRREKQRLKRQSRPPR